MLKVGQGQEIKASGKSQADAEMRVVRTVWERVIAESKGASAYTNNHVHSYSSVLSSSQQSG